MGRKLAFSVRYREKDGSVKSRLMFAPKLKKGKVTSNGKVLSVKKVSRESMLKVGEYNDLPEKLMREFSRNGKNGSSKQEVKSYG